jgi:hypothetical protein
MEHLPGVRQAVASTRGRTSGAWRGGTTYLYIKYKSKTKKYIKK